MSGQIENLYKVQKKDISKAGAVLADAFQHDPVWTEFFSGEAKIDQKQVFFESPVRYCLKYGEVYATSENLEGIAAWVPSDFADMTFWRAIRSGSFSSVVKMGMKMARHAMKMKTVFEPLEAARKANMKERVYIYLIIIGVVSKFQGQGFGGKLLGALIEKSEQIGAPLYLETATERNIRIYERLGFRVLSQITLPIINLPQWGMVREPKV